jgi:hypothetical protein
VTAIRDVVRRIDTDRHRSHRARHARSRTRRATRAAVTHHRGGARDPAATAVRVVALRVHARSAAENVAGRARTDAALACRPARAEVRAVATVRRIALQIEQRPPHSV